MDQPKLIFPHVISDSMMSSFRNCPMSFNLEYLQHWKSQMPNVHLHAGACFASGLEVARDAFYVIEC